MPFHTSESPVNHLYDLEAVMKRRYPFTLVKRRKKTCDVWYYRLWDADGVRREYSTGETSKAKALAIVSELAKTGGLLPERMASKDMSFGAYSVDWWIWDKCPYVQGELLRGKKIGKRHVHNSRSALDRYVLPTFGKVKLKSITRLMVERWHRSLVTGKNLSAKTANNILSVLSVMLGEAVRNELITKNPCADVKPFVPDTEVRGVLSWDEAKDLLANPAYWDSRECHAASYLSACTGMREGEIIALQVRDVYDERIHVKRAWGDMDGIKSTKTGDERLLPLPDDLNRMLHEMIAGRPDEAFVFSADGGNTRIDDHTLLRGLQRALEAAGIDYVSRNICFHSWRHFLNTQLLGHGISEVKTRKITGHTSTAMMDHYTHFTDREYRDVLEVVSGLSK